MATENLVVWHVSCLQQAQRCPFTELAPWALRKVLTTIDRRTTTAYLYAHVGVTLSRCFGCATPSFALQHERCCSSETSLVPYLVFVEPISTNSTNYGSTGNGRSRGSLRYYIPLCVYLALIT